MEESEKLEAEKKLEVEEKEIEESKPVEEPKVVRETVYVNQTPSFGPSTVNIPNEYKPISMWGYFGYELLFAIPCIGFIMICVFAFGGTQNVNLKNFARSYFCFLIIGLVIFAFLALILGVSFGAFVNN